MPKELYLKDTSHKKMKYNYMDCQHLLEPTDIHDQFWYEND